MSELLLNHPDPWRFEELYDLPDEGRGHRYEVVDGNLFITPCPTPLHQWATSEICFRLGDVCPPGWRVCHGFALPMGADGRVTDIAVFRAEAPLRGLGPYPVGPEFFGLVIEVVSPATRKTDHFMKPAEYAEVGIPLFWRVELEPELRIDAFELREGAYAAVEGPLPVPWGTIDLDPATLLD